MPPVILWNLTFVSNAGDKFFLVAALGVTYVIYFFALGYKKEALLTLVSLFSTFFSWILKFTFKQPRPVTAESHIFLDYYGFPSSHTLTYTALFGFLIYLMIKLTFLPLPIRIISVLLSIYFIGLVGISRIYLGQHYALDVVAGYIFGALYLVGLIILDKRL